MENKSINKVAIWIFDLAVNVLIIFGLVIVIQTWIIAPFDVSGSSMCDNLNYIDGECQSGHGEKIIINKALYLFNQPERGDIVVFKVKENAGENIKEDKYFIKRVIGLPGETITLESGKVYVTLAGETEKIELKEPYLNANNQDNTQIRFDSMSVFQIPEDHYFVLGDNREVSTDSRSCFGNPTNNYCPLNPDQAYVSADIIQGKTWIVWWPLPNMKIIQHPDYPELQSAN